MVYAAIDSTDTLEGLTSRDGWQDVGTLLVVGASFETRNRGKNKLSISKTPARRATTAARRLQRRAEMAGRGKDAAQDTSRFSHACAHVTHHVPEQSLNQKRNLYVTHRVSFQDGLKQLQEDLDDVVLGTQ